MNYPVSDRSPREQQLDAIIAEYYRAAEQGQPLDPDEVLRRHPEFSAELLEFFADIGQFEKILPPLASSEPGTIVAIGHQIRDYRILKMLGAGGMGTVYLALHTRLDKFVALKIMKSDRSGNAQAISRFEREMKAIGRLEHTHIVRALDAGEQEGIYFLVMEYVAGTDIDHLIRSRGPLSVADACEIARQTALGLAHAHEHNLVHRDVKPSNLMLSPDGVVKVLDLGLAQFQQSSGGGLDLTLDGQMIGTFIYMSPEQLAGNKNLDHRSDIFSLGVALYCMLAGGLPLDRGQTAAKLPDINKMRTDIPPDVQSLLSKLLATAPGDRIHSMALVAELLESSASGRPLIDLAREAQNWLSHRTTLPPSILPPRATTCRAPAAEITTAVATHGQPSVIPEQVREVRRSANFNWKNSVWAAAGLACLAIVTMLIATQWPKRPPPPISSGTLVIATAEADRLRLADWMVEYGIRAVDAEGRMFELRPGPNPLPPGSYRIGTRGLEDPQLPTRSIEIVATQSLPFDITLPPVKPLGVPLFAAIPEKSGPLSSYTGTLWYKDAGKERSCSFSIKLRAKDEELIAGVPHRWIEIEVATHVEKAVDLHAEEAAESHAEKAVEYRETGLLLIDPAAYTRDFDFLVKRGWLAAESDSIRRRLDLRYPDVPAEQRARIVVEYDETDCLAQRAKELAVALPDGRLSVQHVLVLFFNAAIPHAPEALKTWRVMPANDRHRIETHEPRLRPRYHVLTSAADDQPLTAGGAYSIEVDDALPFGFKQLMYRDESLRFSFSCLSSNDSPAAAPPAIDEFSAEAASMARLPTYEPDPIGEALLPKYEGAMAKYLGSLERGGQPPIDFEAHLRMGGSEEDKEGVALRVLEVRAITILPGSGKRHVEEARLRIDPERYERGEFVVADGWFRTVDKTFDFTFDFEPAGDLTAVEENLLILGKPLPENRLSVHDILGLVFGAELKASAGIFDLRKSVRRKITAAGLKRQFEETEFARTGRPSLTADRWFVPKREGVPLSYEFIRSRQAAFDFCKVNFEITQPQRFKIVTGLDDDQERDAPSLFAEIGSARDPIRETQSRINKEKAADPNVKDWFDSVGKRIAFAEFAGTLVDSKTNVDDQVLLLTIKGDLIKKKLADLSEADRKWVELGRYWGNGKRGRFIKYFSSMGEFTVQEENGTKTYEIIDLPDDLPWVLRQLNLRKTSRP